MSHQQIIAAAYRAFSLAHLCEIEANEKERGRAWRWWKAMEAARYQRKGERLIEQIEG